MFATMICSCKANSHLQESIVETASDNGIDSIVIGMPHRGRLNILANTMRKPYRAILQGFQAHDDPSTSRRRRGSGDVKYHLAPPSTARWPGKHVRRHMDACE